MLDGESQVARDAVLRAGPNWESHSPFPSRWNCPKVQPWLYGYDAVAEANKAVQDQDRLSSTKSTPVKL